MSECIHHVAGRLRLKLAQIRKQPQRAQEIRSAACRINGVTSVEANVVTGSLLIHYDATTVDAQTIIGAMREMGLLPPEAAGRRGTAYRSSGAVRPPMSPLADKVVNMMVEKLIERSAIALVGALF